MATLVFTALGAQLGGTLLGGIAGAGISTLAGKAVGGVVGRYVDEKLFGNSSKNTGSKPAELLRVTTAHHGAPIGEYYGRNRVAGHIIWSGGFRAKKKDNNYRYYASFALAIGEGEIHRFGRVWSQGEEITLPKGKWRFYSGTLDQEPDPLIIAKEGAENTPAYRGIAYIVFEDIDLTPYYNRIPQFQFEVFRHPKNREGEVRDLLRGVSIIPGSGEYVYATEAVEMKYGNGESKFANHTRARSKSDFIGSLEDLSKDLPNCHSASLVVSWFGNDLRVDECQITPRVDQKKTDGSMKWCVSGLTRDQAQMPNIIDGSAVYGGTPDDRSVVDAIRAMRQRGISVMFYPFILMDVPEGNHLIAPDGKIGQPVNPWRGRITIENAKQIGADMTQNAVDKFLGDAKIDDFVIENDSMRYFGPQEWGYRRFILHYAYLCKLAGGVDEFLIGSELIGLTQIHTGGFSFPFVKALIKIAADCRKILGKDVKIGYAADWSEYFGYAPKDEPGAFYFHLDELWADKNIDFIGIDNYMPISDWRHGAQNIDQKYGSIYDLGYLQGQIEGGEGFDWFYENDEARDKQYRTKIFDYLGEDWIWRYKDIRGWWSNLHYNRPDGEKFFEPTEWKPHSKPIYFTEFGAAAIDLASNQPNKFLDPKSSESCLPHYSSAQPDPFIQAQYINAICEYWKKDENNPISPIYRQPMIDIDKCYYWCWDARPWPEFPARSDLWSDAENFKTGHWINGRVNAPKLANVIADICHVLGVENIDVSQVYGQISGVSFAGDESIAQKLEVLMRTYLVDAYYKDRKLWFVSRGYRNSIEIDMSSLVPQEDGARWLISQDVQNDIPARFELGYVAGDVDYETQFAVANYAHAKSDQKYNFSANLVLSENEANDLAKLYFRQFEEGKERLDFNLANTQKLSPGDIINFEPAGAQDYMVSHVSRGAFQEIEAFAIRNEVRDLGLANPRKISKGLVSFLPWVETLDLPCFTSSELRFVASHAQWSSPLALEINTLRNVRVKDEEITQPSLMGSLCDALPEAMAGRAQAVDILIELNNPQNILPVFEDASMPLMVVGESDSWELVGIGDYIPIDNRRILLKKIYRGMFHSEIKLHPSKSKIVILGDEDVSVSEALFGQNNSLELEYGPVLSEDLVAHKTLQKPSATIRALNPVYWRMNGNIFEASPIYVNDWDYWDGNKQEDRLIFSFSINDGGKIIFSAESHEPRFDLKDVNLSQSSWFLMRTTNADSKAYCDWERRHYGDIRRIA